MVTIPSFLKELLADAILVPVTEGLSGAIVWRVEVAGVAHYYLKAASATNAELRAEIEKMVWIAPRFPAPSLVAFGVEAAQSYGLTTAVQGIVLSELLSDNSALTIVKSVGEALQRLHQIPIGDCPFDMRLTQRLALAEARLHAGDVELDNFDAERQGQSADALWAEVLSQRPATEDIVVTHGDFSPANVLINPETLEVSGLIDWGRAGVADRYQDIALMMRELEPELHAAFLEGYGWRSEIDEKRVDYYQLLDEFF